MTNFKDYEYEQKSIAVRFHEGGHAGIAKHKKYAIRIQAEITSVETGVTKLTFPNDTPDEVKFDVAVAGCLAEAKAVSGRDIEIEDESLVSTTATNIFNGLKGGQNGFPVEVAVSGGRIQQANCNDGDFEWLDGEPDLQKITDAIKTVGEDLNLQTVWDEVELVAGILLISRTYDSADHELESGGDE